MQKHDFDVIVVGNAGVDTNIFLNSPEIDFSVEANFTTNIDYVGQAGGYTSRGFAQLGWRTAYVGALGNDHNGQFVRNEFQNDRIDISGVFLDEVGTARSVNIIHTDGQRKNFYDGKSHMTIMPDLELCRSLFRRTNLVHFNIPNWARHLLGIVREAGAKISCDIQDIITPYDAYRQDFIDSADVLFFSSANVKDPISIIQYFLQKKPTQIVICGMGKHGCAVGSTNGIWQFDPPRLDLPILDTNGAGDGLSVGFLSSYFFEGHNLETSILRAQIVARFTCGQKASTSNLITREGLNQYSQLLHKK